MPCFHPIDAYKSATVGASGKRGIVFNKAEGFVDLPLQVPCGQCIGCRIDRVTQWSTRLIHEAQLHEQKSFITLTYDDENFPPGGTLVKRDLQLFLKRLRFEHGGKLRYYACGEYGENYGRPHYHLILYGCDFSDRKKHSGKDQSILYTSEILSRIWGKGFAVIGSVTSDSCGYVASYVIPRVTGKAAEKHYERVDSETGEIYSILPEFATMSRRPGIASGWYEKFNSDVHSPGQMKSAVVKGREIKVPQFYDKQLEKKSADELKQLKLKRKRFAYLHKANNTPERLQVREECAKAKRKNYSSGGVL